jgi:hypothetical protein
VLARCRNAREAEPYGGVGVGVGVDVAVGAGVGVGIGTTVDGTQRICGRLARSVTG